MRNSIITVVAVGLVFCICQAGSADPIVTTLTSYADMDLSGTGVVLAVAGGLPTGQITVGNVTFQSLSAYYVSTGNPGYDPYTMTGGNNGAGYGGTWGTAPDLGSDPEDQALATLVGYEMYSGDIHRLGLLANTTYTFQGLFRDNWDPNTGPSLSNFFINDTNNDVNLLSVTNIPVNSGPNGVTLVTATFNTGDNTSVVWGDSGNGFGVWTLAIPTSTPEPATMGLLLMGGIGALLRRRR
jgi:hypothetical protein